MKPLYRLAVRLYPAWWRRRYGREFEALLDEASPGWFGLLDVLIGACTMRIQTLGTVPVACGVAGALVGGILAARSPVVFASSATLRVESPDVATTNSHAPKDLLVSLESALGPSREARRATSVMVLKGDDPPHATIRVTYQDRNPAEAQRVVERLTAAISEHASSSAVIEPAQLPSSPVTPGFVWPVASGGVCGLAVGGLALLWGRARRPVAGPR